MAFFFNNQFQQFIASHIPFFDPHTFAYNEEAAVQAAMEASLQEPQQQQQQQGRSRGPPPASPRVMRSLPQIRVTPEDLVNENNRECCICLEVHALHEHALRLPCAHIFHPPCIVHWLQSTCTCPVCRYELPTEDAAYEAGRVARMKERKPRFARHELNRLPVKQLLQLLRKNNKSATTYQPVDRQDLIDYLIKSASIEIIATPEPVEYSLQDLRAMTVSQLRRCMNDEAGVFFDPKDVIEKEDMIHIFLLSGRLLVLPEEEEQEEEAAAEDVQSVAGVPNMQDDDDEHTKPAAVSRAPVVETVTNEDDSETAQDERTDRDILMEESGHHSSNDNGQEKNAVESFSNEDEQSISGDDDDRVSKDIIMEESDHHVDETPTSDPADDSDPACDAPRSATAEPNQPAESQDLQNENEMKSEFEQLVNDVDDGNIAESYAAPVTAPAEPMDSEPEFPSRTSSATHSEESSDTTETSAASSSEHYSSLDGDSRRGRKRPLRQPSGAGASDYSTTGSDGHVSSRFDTLSISELRNKGREMSIDLSDCIERQEMIRRLSSSESIASASNSSKIDANEAVEATLLDDWSVSEIRAVARLVEIDLFGTTTRQEMINAICRGTAERPHAGRFLRALVPFVGLSVSQLRATAREMQICLSGCIEKDDILSRLVESKMAVA